MIKIINGVFGFNDGKTVTPKTPKDEPFEAPAEIEARLVKEGVAVYVGPSLGEDEKSDEPGEPSGIYNDNTKFEELKEIAIKLGATEDDLKGKNSKDKLKALIDDLIAPQDEVGGESDEDSEGESTPPADGEDDGPDFGKEDGVAE